MWILSVRPYRFQYCDLLLHEKRRISVIIILEIKQENEMLIAVRAEVEDVDAWREGFKTHGDLFKSQGVSVAYMGTTESNSVIGVFETNDVDEFIRIFNDPATAEAMANDKITGGVELFVLNETFSP